MDVTEQYLRTVTEYNGSGSSKMDQLSPSRTLVLTEGNTMQKAIPQNCTVVPFDFKYEGNIGLFGQENIFFKINLDIKDSGNSLRCFEEPGWECVKIDTSAPEKDINWDGVIIDSSQDLTTVNGYEPAEFTNEIVDLNNQTLFGITLENEGIGNMYEDRDIDVRLYTANRFEHAYNELLLPKQSTFYVGIHCRNTKRTGFKVNCKIGTSFINSPDLTNEEQKLLPVVV